MLKPPSVCLLCLPALPWLPAACGLTQQRSCRVRWRRAGCTSWHTWCRATRSGECGQPHLCRGPRAVVASNGQSVLHDLTTRIECPPGATPPSHAGAPSCWSSRAASTLAGLHCIAFRILVPAWPHLTHLPAQGPRAVGAQGQQAHSLDWVRGQCRSPASRAALPAQREGLQNMTALGLGLWGCRGGDGTV